MKIEKIAYLMFATVLGFTVYYTYSVYTGSKQMAEYELAKAENEKLIYKLDTLSKHFDGNAEENQVVELVNRRQAAYKMRYTIEYNKAIGSAVYQRRLIKLYFGLGVLVLSTVLLYLRKKPNYVN